MAQRKKQVFFNASRISLCIEILCLSVCSVAQITPFASGVVGGTLGALQCALPVYAINPATPAAFLSRVTQQGFAVDALRYYTATAGTASGSPLRVTAGYWYGNNQFSLKTALSFFDAWGIYHEEEALVSMGTMLTNRINASIDFRISQARLSGIPNTLVPRMLCVGETVHYAGKSVHLVAQIGDVMLMQTGNSLRRMYVRGSVESAIFWGAQGISCEYRRGEEKPYRIFASEEFALGKNAGLSVSLATNPSLIAIAFWGRTGNATGHGLLINHPILGWSQGGGASFSFP